MAATIIKERVNLTTENTTQTCTTSNRYLFISEDNKGIEVERGKGPLYQYSITLRMPQSYGAHMSLYQFAEIVGGCFSKESNFFKCVNETWNFEPVGISEVSFEYNQISILLTDKNITSEQIVGKWKRKEKLVLKGDYYLISITRIKSFGEYHGRCFVLASTKERAIKKVNKMFGGCECTCIGKYNKIKNTFLVDEANKYLDFDEKRVVD